MNELFFNDQDYLINEWPEVFEDMQVNTIPVAYLDYVQLTFKTGMIWKIDIKNYLNTLEADTIADLLRELLNEYKNEIKTLKYKLNTDTLKKDIKKLSHPLLA